MDERRDKNRYQVWFPVELDADALKKRLAVTRNVSSRGLLLSASTNLDEGSKVIVTFRVLPGDAQERSVQGTIIRVEKNTDDPDGLWPLRIAVEFDQPIPEIEAKLKEAESIRKAVE